MPCRTPLHILNHFLLLSCIHMLTRADAAAPDADSHAACSSSSSSSSSGAAAAAWDAKMQHKPILVVGSVNVDIIIEVLRLPTKDETITARSPKTSIAVGGKGANQAVAAARLLAKGTAHVRRTHFACQFGNDAHAAWLESTLRDNDIVVSGSGHVLDFPSGQGIVFLEPDGAVSSIVVGGSNTAWGRENTDAVVGLVQGASVVLLQREVPEHVNEAVAEAAHAAGVPVMQVIPIPCWLHECMIAGFIVAAAQPCYCVNGGGVCACVRADVMHLNFLPTLVEGATGHGVCKHFLYFFLIFPITYLHMAPSQLTWFVNLVPLQTLPSGDMCGNDTSVWSRQCAV